MANGDAITQMALAHDLSFLDRLQYILTQQALAVINEVNTTPNHPQRVAYAKYVLQNAASAAVQASVAIVGSANLVAANTTVLPGPPPTATTDASDAAILSQIATYWNDFSGVST